jgi:ketosteroid isomerase-like protein
MAGIESIAREYLESFNRRDWDRIRALFAPTYSYTGADGTTQQGPEAGLAVVQMWAGAFSDAKVEIRAIHVAGDTAIVEFQGGGTQDGEREYMDMAHMMQQLGVMPAAAHA